MKKFLLLWLVPLVVQASPVPTTDFAVLFNRLPGEPIARAWNLGTLLYHGLTTLTCTYDFATSGGAVGNINLLTTDLVNPCKLPGKAVIRNGSMDVTTAVTSGAGGGFSLSSGKTAADLLAFTATTLATGESLLIPRYATAATFIKLPTANTVVSGKATNGYQVVAAVSTAALTAGHFRVFIDYVIGE